MYFSVTTTVIHVWVYGFYLHRRVLRLSLYSSSCYTNFMETHNKTFFLNFKIRLTMISDLKWDYMDQ